MLYSIEKQYKKTVDAILRDKEYLPIWKGDKLVVADSKEDDIYDILCDYNIPFVKESES